MIRKAAMWYRYEGIILAFLDAAQSVAAAYKYLQVSTF